MDDTILVTGSTANLGNQVVKQLSSFDRRVCAAVQSKNRVQEIPRNSYEPITVASFVTKELMPSISQS